MKTIIKTFKKIGHIYMDVMKESAETIWKYNIRVI